MLPFDPAEGLLLAPTLTSPVAVEKIEQKLRVLPPTLVSTVLGPVGDERSLEDQREHPADVRVLEDRNLRQPRGLDRNRPALRPLQRASQALTATRLRTTGLWFLIAIATSLSSVAYAGPGAWTSGGPYGGRIYDLAIDPRTPTTLYVLTYGGVSKSTDSGGTWAAANTGLSLTTMYHAVLAVNPTTPATLFAGTDRDGVFKSTDSGGTWVAANTGLTNLDVTALAVNPATPATLFAGADGSGVFKSTDSGGTWAPANVGLTNPFVTALAINPTTPATLYAGTDYSGVFRSTDAGGTWAAANKGLPNFSVVVTALAVNPAVPATLYAGTFGGRVFGGVFKSTDSGASWAAANTGLTNLDITALAINPATPATLYAGTFESGVFRSTDSGATWAAANTGLTSLDVTALAINPATPATLYAGTFESGVFRSTDSGATWAANPGLTNHYVTDLAINPATPATLYAGTYGGVFRSTDSGGTWAPANMGMPGLAVTALAINPTTPTTLYALTTHDGVFKSTDSGGTWAPANTGLGKPFFGHALAIDPTTPATLYVLTVGGGVFKSTDSGATWAAANTSLTGRPDPFVRTLAISRAAPATLYAGTYGGVFRSTDSGGTWAPANMGLTNLYVTDLAINPATPATLYAGTFGGGVFKSTDSGASWAAAKAGLPHLYVSTLALDPTGATTLFAGLGSGSVWQYTPGTAALVPSSARATGLGGAFYTTDLTVANTGPAPTTFVVKFLGNNTDGRRGPERSFPIGAGASTTFTDVLGSVFGLAPDYGAMSITSPSDSIRAIAQTSTRGFGGTFGQSVPASRPEDLVTGGTPRSILAVREDEAFRTNLILANATEDPLEVDVTLVADSGATLTCCLWEGTAAKRFTLPPLGMTQINRVVRALGVPADVSGARLVLSTPSVGKSFAAYASLIDNVTNDPRTLLPVGPIASARPLPDYWILPSSVRAYGAEDASYTTDLTVATTDGVGARFTLKFLGNNVDGRGGPEATFDLGAQKSVTYTDVLGSVFHRTSDFGAIRIASLYPSSDSRFIGVQAQTSTPGFGGTFGQGVPAATAADLIRAGTVRSILAVKEDDSSRTNLLLTNATEAALDVDVQLVSAEGAVLATKRYSLAPLGMTQVTKVVRDLGIATNVTGARLVISTPTAKGAFAAYASVIDNATNDPRTLLPR